MMYNKARSAGASLRSMEALAGGHSPVHRLHPAAKLFVTVLYIGLTVSFPKYSLSALAVMALYPVVLFQLSGLRMGECFYKMRYLLPLLLAVGIANPFLDRAPLLRLGSVTLTGGVVSMLTLMCKGVFALQASYLLMATTKLEALCAALRRLHVPSLLVSLLLLTYRYISVLLEQAALLSDAYALRAPEQRGVHFRAWGSFLGQLLLRSMDRASALYQAMQLRGYTGEFPYATSAPFQLRDGLFLLGAGALLILARCYDLPVCLGRLLVGL